ncbi:MAG: sigma-70 family RNA polymerase sigma factor [Planctomycetes bacterium]|nr:sigma-70 family RNA polymerase sigma factor [Planctomycetota bacterium]MBL7144973.1 sigma-70 family RNA polymerase sigma factor [Phycisphaerae bacterium]
MCTCGQKTQYLVVLAKNGDKSALNQLYGIYAERVRWMVRFRMGKELRSKLESMDVVQDTLIHALNDLHDFTYKNEGDFVRWLSTIAENVLRGNLKKLHAYKRDIRREVPIGGYGPTTGSRFVGNLGPIEATTPSMVMSKKEDLIKLENAIDQLKPEHRRVIVLAKIDGLSYKEIGKKLGKSADAAGMLLSRAMLALTNVFESN